MPTYEYRCKDCGHELEVVQAFTDDALTECPSCQGSLKKVFGNVGITFKGSGFYKTDSRNGSGAKTAEKAGADSSGSSDAGSSSSGSDKGGSEKSTSSKGTSDKGSSEKSTSSKGSSSSDSKGSGSKPSTGSSSSGSSSSTSGDR
ncbi:MAG: FmdB family transcriptional regulator [Acidimicrobiales bacterium]|nr:FmdB family transcriptional regulator [Acidimicrobiales bacterium]